MIHPRSVLFAFVCLLATQLQAAEPATAKFKILRSHPLLMKAPAGISGDFDIAKAEPLIRFAILPGQTAGATLWSSWGETTFAGDGKFYAAIGDHGSPHGMSYVFAVDPATGAIERVLDYSNAVGIAKDRYSPGKIHGKLVDIGDWIYAIGHDGSLADTTPANGFGGNWLVRFNIKTGEVENLGIVAPHVSVPTMIGHRPSAALFGLGVPGKSSPESDKNIFFHYNLRDNKLMFSGGPPSEQARGIIVAEDTRAWYGHRDPETKRGILIRYDGYSNTTHKSKGVIPGDGILRAASRHNKRGVVYCFTMDGVLFTFDTTNEKVKELNKAFVAEPQYVTSCILDPTGKYLYYAPGAHGNTDKIGTPVIQYNTVTNRRKVLCFLNPLLRGALHYNLGGTYGLSLNADGSQLFINWNGAPEGSKDKDFGQCSVMLLDIPASERE